MDISELMGIDISFLPNVMVTTIQILLIMILGIIAYKIFKLIIFILSKNQKRLKKRYYQKRVETIKVVVLNLAKYIITIITFVLILATLGVDITAILAGLGMTGFLIGLAFQDMARDLIAGVSIVIEDQYEIGDTIEVGGFKGEVVFVGLRSTRIRNFEGATKIISNSRIVNVINHNLHNSLAIVDLRLPLSVSFERVEKLLENISKNGAKKLPKAKGDIQILGIDSMDNNTLTYRIAVEVSTSSKYETERILRKEIKLAMDKTDLNL